MQDLESNRKKAQRVAKQPPIPESSHHNSDMNSQELANSGRLSREDSTSSRLDPEPKMVSGENLQPNLQYSHSVVSGDDLNDINKKELGGFDIGLRTKKDNYGVGIGTEHELSGERQVSARSHFINSTHQTKKPGNSLDFNTEPASTGILNHPKTDKTKHKPVSPQGTKFLWRDNMQYHDFGATPFKLNEPQPDLLVLKLKATTGIVYSYVFPENNIPDWTSQTFVTRANRWFHQIIIRHLDNNPANKQESTKRPSRPQWSLQEQSYLHDLIEQALEKSENGRLTEQDWEKITAKQNQRFVGDSMRIGQGFVDLRAMKQDKNLEGMRKGWSLTTTTDKPFTTRPVGGCKSAIKYWPETRDMMLKAAEDSKAKKQSLSKFSVPSTNKSEEDDTGLKEGIRSKKRKSEPSCGEDDDFHGCEEVESPVRVRTMAKRSKSVSYEDESEPELLDD